MRIRTENQDQISNCLLALQEEEWKGQAKSPTIYASQPSAIPLNFQLWLYKPGKHADIPRGENSKIRANLNSKIQAKI